MPPATMASTSRVAVRRARIGALRELSLPALAVGLLLDNLSMLSLLRIADGAVAQSGLAVSVSPGGLLVAMLLLGALCSAFGGYAAARVAGRAEGAHGALVGLGAVAIGAWGFAVAPGTPPFWYTLLAFTTVVPAAVAGSLLAQRSVPRRSSTASGAAGSGIRAT